MKILIVSAHPDGTLNKCTPQQLLMQTPEERRVKRRIWEAENRKRPEVITKRRAYKQRPEVKERHRIQSKKRRLEHGDLVRASNRGTYAKNKEHYQKKAREQRQRNRRLCIEYYSKGKMVCACCNESEYLFLTIDHINGGGLEHRKQIGAGNLYSWLKVNNFPLGFRVLCYNCNQVRGHYGKCPHQEVV